jgi:hypothetical protein
LLLLLEAACDGRPEGPAPVRRSLEGDLVARVETEAVVAETVRRIARAQGVSAEEALDRAVFDAILAVEARTRLGERRRRREENRVLAAALIAELARSARAEGAPTDAEIDDKTKKRWLDVDRPESVLTVHAVVLVPAGSDDAAWVKADEIAGRIRDAVAPSARSAKEFAPDPYDFKRPVYGGSAVEEFRRLATAVPHEGMSVRVEALPPVAADGLTVTAEGRQPFDPAFASAAASLGQGDLSPVVRSPFGAHVILGLVRIPASRVGLEERRRRFADEIYADRTRERTKALLASVRAQTPAAVERSADASLEGIGALP